jgi:L-aminopeptidase/D-esterase-like protein
MDQAIKAGIGTASLKLGDGIIVGALVVVNAYGSLVDHIQGKLVAGPRNGGRDGFCDTVEFLLNGDQRMSSSPSGANTTIGVIATNARLTKEQANFLAKLSHDGLALTIRPCHTTRDGDTLFSMATGTSETKADITRIGAAAVEVVAMAVLRSVKQARGLGGIPSISEYIDA